jgi:hypothetical protein
MERADVIVGLRRHIKKQRAELLESLLTTKEVRRTRGRILELDDITKKLNELSKQGELDDGDQAD